MKIEYIAGFFDGEGCVSIKSATKVRLQITQTNEEVLLQIKDFFGVGKIHSIKTRKKHWKQAWVYYTAGNRNTQLVLSKLLKHLIVKKDVALSALKLLKDLDRVKQKRERLIGKAVSMIKTGKSYRQIEKETGISRQTIYKRKKVREAA